MTFKAACKTAITLTILSFVLILTGRVINFISFFIQTHSEHNGWSFAPDPPALASILTQLLISFMPLLYPGMLLVGFIPLLSGHLKQQHNPLSNTKKEFTIAVVFLGLAALLMIWKTVGSIWITFYQQPYLSFYSCLSLCWHLIAALCALSLFIFIVARKRKTAARTPAILAIVCHWIMVALMVAATAITLHRGLAFKSDGHFGSLFHLLWFASAALSYSGKFLWLTAVLLFLFSYLRNK